MSPFDRAHTTFYSTLIETMRLSCNSGVFPAGLSRVCANWNITTRRCGTLNTITVADYYYHIPAKACFLGFWFVIVLTKRKIWKNPKCRCFSWFLPRDVRLCIRGTSHGPVSVGLSVSLSVRHQSEF